MQQDAETNDAARARREMEARSDEVEGEGGAGRKGAVEDQRPPTFLRKMNKDVYFKNDTDLGERINTRKGHVEGGLSD
jgi:hypothetical protein